MTNKHNTGRRMNDLQRWLVVRMAENGLTPAAIARKLGFAQPSIADWLKRNPVQKKATYICDLCSNKHRKGFHKIVIAGEPWVLCDFCFEGVQLRLDE